MKKPLKRLLAGVLAGMMLLTSESSVVVAADIQETSALSTEPVMQSETAVSTITPSQSETVLATEMVPQTEASAETVVQTESAYMQTSSQIETVQESEPAAESIPVPETSTQNSSDTGSDVETGPEETDSDINESENREDTVSESDEEIPEPARDWSARKDYFLFRMDESDEMADEQTFVLEFSFLKTDETYMPKPGDTAVLMLPDSWVDVADITNAADVLAFADDEYGNENSLNIKIGEYTISQGMLHLEFTEGIEAAEIAEAITSIYGKIIIPFTWQEDVQKAYEQDIQWTLQTYDDGSENEAVLHIPARTPMDWSDRKDEFLFEAEISSSSENDRVLSVSFSFPSGEDHLLAQDTARLRLPVEWMNIENFSGDVNVKVGSEEVTEITIGKFTVTDGELLITFTEEAQSDVVTEHMESLVGTIDIPFVWKDEVYDWDGPLTWVLQSYDDGSDHSVQLDVPVNDPDPDEESTEDSSGLQDESLPVEDEEDESESGSMADSANAILLAASEITLGGYVFKNDNTLKYNQDRISRDIYWIDNNNGQLTRPSPPPSPDSSRLKFNGSFSYTDDSGQPAQISLTGLSWEDVCSDSGQLTVTDLGGTGHWQLNASGLLSEGVLIINGVEYKGTFSGWTIEQADDSIPVFGSSEDYAAVLIKGTDGSGVPYDQNGNPRPGAADTQGWYYVQKTDYTADILVRAGTTKFTMDSLEKAIEQAYSFYWKTGIISGGQDVNSGSVSLETIESWIQVNWNVVNNQLTGDVTLKGLEKYNLDGSEMIYYVDGDDHQDVSIKVVGSADNNELKDGDFFAESVENNSVGNWGTNTTEVHNGGKLILTLTGYTDYNATKEWHDDADPSQRPRVDFYLWRFTQKENTDLMTAYQTAAPVKATKENDYGEVGQTAVYTIAENSTGDEISFSFADSFTDVEGHSGYLPKYDPEGYNYVYLSREYMGAGSERYRTEYGSLDEKSDTFIDTLPYAGDRQSPDNSIYNNGSVSNVLTATTGAGVEKTWIADAFQSELSDVVVELTLRSRPVKSGQGDDENWKDTSVTYKMGEETPFIAEFLNQSHSVTLPKYNNSGQELEYRWIESGVYQGSDGKNLLNPDGTFTLIQRGQNVEYTSKVTVSRKDTFYTSITNEIKDETDYYLEKIWEEGVEPKEISLILYRINSVNEQQRISTDPNEPDAVFTMDGKADDEPVTLYYKGKIVGHAQETSPWYAEFTGLEKYNTDGSLFDYIALEDSKGPWLVQYGTRKDDSGKVIQTITNGPPVGESQQVLLRKRWLDDGDEQHRGAVTFTLYEIPEDVTEITNEVLSELPSENKQSETLSRDHDWWTQVSVPVSWNLDRLLVLETSVASVDSDGHDAILTYTDEQLNQIFKLQRDDPASDNENNPYIPYKTTYHKYEAAYSMVTLEDNNVFYTVTNRRLGAVDIEVTKNWVDGSTGTPSQNRQKLLDYLEDQGYELVFRLEGAAYGDSSKPQIDYEHDTVTFGREVVPILDKDGKASKAVQSIDTNNSTSVYYFYNLPKYDLYGRLVSYTVKEMLKNTATGEIVEISSVLSGDSTQDYTFSITQSGYTVTHGQNDKQTFTATNALSGEKDVFFWKEWNDAYRNRRGERPDIYLSLYKLEYDKEGNEMVSAVYLDRRWTFTDNSVSHCDFGEMPKYDAYGNEIIYYAQEKILTDKKAFDYTDVYYKYDARLEDADINDPFAVINKLESIGDETGPVDPQNPDGQLYEYNGIWLLKEYGVFVNELKAQVFINGKKIWANIPAGFLEEDLPDVEFKLYQFSTNDLGGNIPDIPAADADSSEYEGLETYATLKITDWDQQKIKGEYLFTIEYQGINVNTNSGDQITAQPGDPLAGTLPKYDDEGFLYEYRLREAADISGTDVAGEPEGIDLVYKQPTINNYAITNPYDSSLGEIRVKKYLDTDVFTDSSHLENPSIAFKLTRQYKDSQGQLKNDDVFERIQTIAFNDFKNGEAQLVFENLEIYAPNGNKYVYTVEENPEGSELIQGGYKVYSGIGNLDVSEVINEGNTVTGLYPIKVNGSSGFFGLAPKADEEKAWATFKNEYTIEDKAPLHLGKTWTDANNQSDVRPKTLTFEIKRSANAQPGSSNAISEYPIGTVTLTISEEDFNKSSVVITKINGLSFSPGSYLDTSGMIERLTVQTKENVSGDTSTTLAHTGRWVITMESMEIYAPNGMPWKYKITETNVSAPYTASVNNPVFTFNKSTKSYSSLRGAASADNIVNSMSTSTTIWKNWRIAVDNFSNYKNPYGYTIVLETQLYAAGVEISDASVAPDYEGYNNIALWQPVTEESDYWDAVSAYYETQKGGTFDPSKSVSISKGSTLIGKNGSVTTTQYDTLPKIIRVNDKLLYMQYYVMETGVTLKNGAQEIYRETFTPRLELFSSTGKGYSGKSRIGFWLDVKAQVLSEKTDTEKWMDTGIILFTPVVSSKETLDKIHNDGLKSVYTGASDLISDKALYPYINFDSTKVESAFVNLYELTKLDVEKIWENDSGNIYGSRESSGGQWKLKFILQRRDKTNSSEEAWAAVMNGSTPKSITISGKNTEDSQTGTFSQLPVKGLTENENGGYTIAEYEYRAREAQSAGSNVVVDQNGTYRDSYKVTYTDSEKVSVTNELQTIDLYAQKDWTGPFKDTVTFELKYTKEDGSLASFDTPAQVTLDGEADKNQSGAYYEDNSWHAIWKGVPKIVPGSKTTGEGEAKQTVFTIVEISENAYAEPVKGSGTQADPFAITNELTRLRVEKQVETYVTGAVEDREFTFTLNGDLSGIQVNYQKYQKADEGGTDTEIAGGGGSLSDSKRTFKLKDGQYVIIYGLKKESKYTITESKTGSYVPFYQAGNNEPTQNSAQVTIPAQKPAIEDDTNIVVTNKLFGKLTIEKVDEKDNPLAGVTFKLEKKISGSDPDPQWEEVKSLTTTNSGTAQFTNLELNADYLITEVSVPAGYFMLGEPIEIHLPLETDINESGSTPIYTITQGSDTKYYYADVTITIGNNQTLVMPTTSGVGFFWPGLAGLGVLTAGGGFYVYTSGRRKRKKSS